MNTLQKIFIALVIIVSIAAAFLYIGVGVWMVEETKAPRPHANLVLYPEQSDDRIPGDVRFMGLPPAPHCGHLHNHPGKHKLWAECMGVGYNNSKIDALLYSDRGDDAPDCTKVPIRGRNHEWVAYCMSRRGAFRQ